MTRSIRFGAYLAALLALSGCGGGYGIGDPSNSYAAAGPDAPICGSRQDVWLHQLYGVAAPACVYPMGYYGGPGVYIHVQTGGRGHEHHHDGGHHGHHR
ncbi:MAG TPA: hypothetical protein VF439_03550 [Candidatus Paceibacterota bacterium]